MFSDKSTTFTAYVSTDISSFFHPFLIIWTFFFIISIITSSSLNNNKITCSAYLTWTALTVHMTFQLLSVLKLNLYLLSALFCTLHFNLHLN